MKISVAIQHYRWLIQHGLEICNEFEKRYGKKHKTKDVLEPQYNAQNSAGAPQSNKQYVKQYFNHREDTTTDIDAKTKQDLIDDSRKRHARRMLKQEYPDANDSFIESMIIGYLTDSTMLGTALGGDMMGAAVGDMLNDDTDKYSGGDLSEHKEENFS